MTWPRVTLGEVALSVRNGIFSRRPTEDPPGSRILRISAVRGGRVTLDGSRFVEGLGPDQVKKFAINAGDLLVTRYNGSRALVGIAGIVPDHDGLVLHPDKLIRVVLDENRADPRFVNYQFQSPDVRSYLEPRIRTTAGQSGIAGADVRSIPLVLPPIDDQRRIVDLLEEHLSRLDVADVQLGVALRRIDSLRVASMRRALDAQQDWKIAPINDWLTTSIGGLWGKASGKDEVDVRVIRVTEMKAWGRIAPGTAAVRSITARQLAGRALDEGDLLLEKSGGGPKSPVGRVGLVQSLAGPSICANFMQLMRPDTSRVNPRFLHYALNAFHLSGGTAPMQTASTNIRNIKASEYVQVKIAVPNLRQQGLLVAQIAAEQDAADRLAAAAVAARTRNAGLRQSLLATAFAGRLTQQPPR